MKRLKLTVITLITITGILCSCSNDDDNAISPTPSNETVYIVGQELGGMSATTKLWKDGVESNMGSFSPADIAVKSDGKVYVFGTSYTNGDENASLIIDGTATVLSNGTFATHLFLSGNDEYLLYNYYSSSGGSQTRLSKNSVVSTVTNSGRAGGLFVSENIPYIAYTKTGTNGNHSVVMLKKGSQEVSITNGLVFGDYAKQVVVSGNDIYILGSSISSKRKIVLWKANKQSSSIVPINITDGTNRAHASNIFVKGSDIYVVGYEEINNKQIATLWKNGTPKRLASSVSSAKDVFVSSNNVYVVGFINDANGIAKATLWKNGTATQLSNAKSIANSIYIKTN